MSDAPWLTIVGWGEDGLKGLGSASRTALDQAEIIMGPERHLALLGGVHCETRTWPVPFADGIAVLETLRGRRVVVLASGDPFWYGAGATLARRFDRNEWVSYPASSTFSLVANHLGWSLEKTHCMGLHAAPLSRLRPALAPGARLIVLLRDGAAVRAVAKYLDDAGFGASNLTIFEAIAGPRARVTKAQARSLPETVFQHPVCVACEVSGTGAALPRASGRDDAWFDSDGQMTKRPIRALTLSALAPVAFEHLWDIGGGSGSIGIEWLLSDPTLQASTIEPRADRAARIVSNAARLGVDRLRVVTGAAPEALAGLEAPDAVFIGGGLSEALVDWLHANLAAGTRVVANAVTLETETILMNIHERLGGDLMRVDVSRSEPLGPRRGWKARYPIVQWSGVL